MQIKDTWNMALNIFAECLCKSVVVLGDYLTLSAASADLSEAGPLT